MKSLAQAAAVMNTARGTAMAAWSPYLALFVGDPLAGGIEASGGGYARQPVVFAAPSGYTMTNSAQVTMPSPTGPWGGAGVPITHAALMDAAVGGAVRYSYLLGGTDAERTVDAGVPAPTFAPGTIVWSET